MNPIQNISLYTQRDKFFNSEGGRTKNANELPKETYLAQPFRACPPGVAAR